MKTILVTGATGYLGHYVIQQLVALQADKSLHIIGLDIRAAHPEHAFKEVTYVVANITSNKVHTLIEEYNVDTVIHLAFGVSVSANEQQNDLIGTENILKACIKYNVKKLITASSGAVYGYYPDSPALISETQAMRGNNDFPYAKYKMLIEKLLAKYKKNYPQLQQTVFRLGTIVGPNYKSTTTEMFQKKNFLAIKGTDCQYSFIWVEDAATPFVQNIFSEKEGIYNLIGGGGISARQVANILNKKLLKLPLSIVRSMLRLQLRLGLTKARPEQVPYIMYRPVMDNSKLKNELGFTPTKTSTQAFKAYVAINKLVKK